MYFCDTRMKKKNKKKKKKDFKKKIFFFLFGGGFSGCWKHAGACAVCLFAAVSGYRWCLVTVSA